MATVRDGADRASHRGLGAAADLVREPLERTHSVLAGEREQSRLHQAEGGDLGPEVANGKLGGPDVAREELEQGLVRTSGRHELHDRDLEPFLEDLACLRGADPAPDVRRVGGARGEPEEIAVKEDRFRDADVGEVPGAHPRVVGDEDVARRERFRRILAQEVPHGARQGADERGDAVRRLGDGAALRIGEDAREIMGLPDNRRERGPHERRRRLVGDGDEPGPEDFEAGRVERAVAHGSRRSAADADRADAPGAGGVVRIITRFPSSSISNRPPGPSTAVDSRSSTIAGPGNRSPGRSA